MKLPICDGEILTPKNGIDLKKWAVIACDQFTSKPQYWEELQKYIGKEYSALNLIFPEVYLSKDNQPRIKQIVKNMLDYSCADIFRATNGYILVKRRTAKTERLGLMMIVDLEQYSFKNEKSLIRATEGTVIERIPPRVEIRKNCLYELPHIMLLIDDEKRTVIEPLKYEKSDVLYDTELNMGGGHITGYQIEQIKKVNDSLQTLLDSSIEKYGEALLFAVGDGNHSLATAKVCWENIKKETNVTDGIARYALVEVMNIYDEGLKFEPIHRVIFNVDKDDFEKKLKLATACFPSESVLFSGKNCEKFNLPAGAICGVAFIQKFIDEYISEFGGSVDYIHGEDELKKICAESDAVGIVLKAMDKNELFEYIVKNGVLPRKTFSMGDAEEKRYYFETRRIKSI